jgi:hypothetical protein
MLQTKNSFDINSLQQQTSDTYILNFCAKHLARLNLDSKHSLSSTLEDASNLRASILEAWQFPIVDKFRDPTKSTEENAEYNLVTLVYFNPVSQIPSNVSVIGSFHKLYEPLALKRIGSTPYFATSLRLPKAQVFTYKFIVDGQYINDLINPQEHQFNNGEVWSRFFTDECSSPVTFSKWEFRVLDRLINQLLPFRTKSAENFLNRYTAHMDSTSRDSQYPHLYRVNQSVGVVNFIDKILAKQERHRRVDYSICLEQINKVLTTRDPINPVETMRDGLFTSLYDGMATNNLPEWDYSAYGDPSYFLKILRRHAFTGAFSHPKYGGNASAAAWAYIAERLRDDNGKTLFDWQANFEAPIGKSKDYNG